MHDLYISLKSTDYLFAADSTGWLHSFLHSELRKKLYSVSMVHTHTRSFKVCTKRKWCTKCTENDQEWSQCVKKKQLVYQLV